MEIHDAIRYNESVLDKIDFKHLLTIGATPDEVMSLMDEMASYNSYDDDIMEMINGDTLEGYLFNYINREDFMEYCSSRYGVSWNSEVRYQIDGIND